MARRSKSSKKSKQIKRAKQRAVPKTPGRAAAAAPKAKSTLPPVDRTSLLWWAVAAALIGAAVLGVYSNTLGNEFVTFDDRKYIYENELVTGDGGLGAIWGDLFNEKPRLHYYPLTFSTFWIEHALVGLEPPDVDQREEPAGKHAHPLYHWTQMVVHAINAALLLFALRMLGIRFPVGVFVVALYAVHPLTVASVAWMAERKNLVSALFIWVTLLLYVLHRRRREESLAYERGLPWIYLASLGAFVLALSAKAAAIVLAPILVVTDWYLEKRWRWDHLVRVVPFFFFALGMIAVTSMREAFIAKSWDPTPIFMRPFIAVAALAHYVQKSFLPVDQALIYPRWPQSLAEPRYWISLAFVAGAAWLIWRYRNWLGKAWLWALGLFVLTVAPVLGLKHFIWMQFAYVSDHYMYYGLPGVLLMVGLLLERWVHVPARKAVPGEPPQGPRWDAAKLTLIGLLLLPALGALGYRTMEQNRTWKNNETLWRHTISIAPECFVARMNLGNHYYRHEQYEEALEHYTVWTGFAPDFARAWRSRARAASQLGQVENALDSYRRAVQVAELKNPQAYSMRTELADYLSRLRRPAEALSEYETVLERNPPTADRIRKRIDTLRRRIEREPLPELPTSPVD